MEKRYLGKRRLAVSAIGLGCMGMSEYYGTTNDAESTATIHAALDAGITLFDTADMYGNGHNEELVGKALKPHRGEVVIATKFGNVRDAQGRRVGVSGKPEYVRQACDASLRRLGVDYIDLFYQHRVDPDTPIEDTVGAMAELVKAGKVRYIGLSEASAKTVRRANAVYPITALQTEYSLWTRDIEAEILPTCRELGIGFVPYGPLGRGFLTLRIKDNTSFVERDFRRTAPRFVGENFQKNLEAVAVIEKIAQRKKCTPAQVALAWVLAQGKDIVPIPGTKQRKYVAENAQAANVKLTPAELEKLGGIAQHIVGTRYPAEAMSRLTG